MPQNNNRENFERFYQRVLSDLSLQEKLRVIEDKQEFIAATVELGAANGFVFGAAEIESVMRQHQQQWIERWM
jgi:hypothetical protein